MKRLDKEGIALITHHEGVRLKAYQDSGGVWTIGYGHTGTAKKGMVITQAQAVRLLERDIERFEDCVTSNVKVPLTQTQYNALVSFAFNRGCNGFRRSRLLELINARKYDEAADVWLTTAVTAGGKRLRGLEKRRRDEVAMFRSEDEGGIGRSLANWFTGGAIKAAAGRV